MYTDHRWVTIEGNEKAVVLNSEDEVSGTTIFPDGTKAYWTEGRSSDVVFKRFNGETFNINNGMFNETPERVIIMTLLDYFTHTASEYRSMTPEEELEHEQARS